MTQPPLSLRKVPQTEWREIPNLSDPIQFCSELQARFGDWLEIEGYPSKDDQGTVMLFHPSAFESVLNRENKEIIRNRVPDLYIQPNFLQENIAFTKAVREANSQTIKAMSRSPQPVILEETQISMRSMETAGRVDFFREMQRLCFVILTRLLFSHRPTDEETTNLLAELARPFRGNNEAPRPIGAIHHLIYKLRGSYSADELDSILGFYNIRVYDALALGVCWTWARLALDSDLRARCRRETKIDTNHRKWELLKKTILESLRLNPVTLWQRREILQSFDVGGYRLPEKGGLLLMCYHQFRHPDFCENPLKFDPEKTHSNPRSLLYPFSYGPRACQAAILSLDILMIVLAKLLENENASLVSGVFPKARSADLIYPVDMFVNWGRDFNSK